MTKRHGAELQPGGVATLQAAARAKEAQITSRVRQHPINDLLVPRNVRIQPLEGFEDVYSDIVHYIAYATHRIWADKAVGLIYSHYDDAVVVHTPYGTQTSVEEVVASTIQMMQSFPDRESRIGNVAWCGNDQDGFYTSHLGTSRMTNLGPTIYGPATGRRVRISHIADCMIRQNRIYREWLVRDNGALVRQMGLEPVAVAKRLAEAAVRSGTRPVVAGLPERGAGQMHPEPLDPPLGAQSSMEEKMRHMFHDVWNLRRFDLLKDWYSPDVYVQTSPGRELRGLQGLFWSIIAMLAALPDAVMHVDHFCDVVENDGYIAAVRWKLVGTHLGQGQFGPPSGQPVVIMGMSHLRFHNGKIVQEWTVWDEISVLMQIHYPKNSLTAAED
jgi:predicted ester cyclase